MIFREYKWSLEANRRRRNRNLVPRNRHNFDVVDIIPEDISEKNGRLKKKIIIIIIVQSSITTDT